MCHLTIESLALTQNQEVTVNVTYPSADFAGCLPFVSLFVGGVNLSQLDWKYRIADMTSTGCQIRVYSNTSVTSDRCKISYLLVKPQA